MSKGHPDRMFKAFSDPTRLRILHVLAEGEFCVGDMVGILRVPQPKVSRHLGYLRRAGLVEARKNGLWNFYRLARPRTALHRHLVACLTSCFRGVPGIQADARKAGKIRRSGGCCPA
jgi:ArsR family transcriptional regulator, arsenate/arsenite/antimonite-responsive transcriptional repressor